jgi:hypothetical protein
MAFLIDPKVPNFAVLRVQIGVLAKVSIKEAFRVTEFVMSVLPVAC